MRDLLGFCRGGWQCPHRNTWMRPLLSCCMHRSMGTHRFDVSDVPIANAAVYGGIVRCKHARLAVK
jgi:hypothetical protein